MITAGTFEGPEVDGEEHDATADEDHLEVVVPSEEVTVVKDHTEAEQEKSEGKAKRVP